MYKSVLDLLKSEQTKEVRKFAEKYRSLSGSSEELNDARVTEIKNDLDSAAEYYYSLITGRDFEGDKVRLPSISFSEALHPTDLSVVLPRVIGTVLSEPKEPNLWLLNEVAEQVNLPDNHPVSVTFPSISAMEAYELADNQDYPNDQPALAESMATISTRRIGLAASLHDDMISQSMWDMVGLYLRMMSAAIDRKVESILFKALTTGAKTVFDNENSDSAYRTQGVASNQAWNATLSYYDLVKMMGVMLGRRYNSTHLLAPPLMWSVFAQDPIMQATFFHGGQLGAGIWTRNPQYDQQAAIPFSGLTYVPYYALMNSTNFSESTTLSGAGSSLAAAPVGDMYLIDKPNTLFMLKRGEKQMDQIDNWYKDARDMKAFWRVGVSLKDNGNAILAAKNIRAARNYEALFTIREVSS